MIIIKGYASLDLDIMIAKLGNRNLFNTALDITSWILLEAH